MIRGLKYTNFDFSQPSLDLEKNNLQEEISFIKKHPLKRMFIRKRNILFIESCRYAKLAAQKRWGINFAFLDFGEKGLIKQVFQTENLNYEAANLWWKKIQINPKFSQDIVQELEKIIEIDKNIVKFLSKKKEGKYDYSEILNLYLSWFSQFFEIVYPWFAIDEMKEKILEPWIIKKYKKQADDVLSEILKPTKMPLSSLEQVELLKISRMKGKNQGVALRKHKDKYDFLAVHQMEDQPFDLKYYQSRIKSLENHSEYEQNKSNLEVAKAEIFKANNLQKKLNFPKEYEALLFLIRSFTYLRTNTIDHMMMVYKSFQDPFRDMARQLGVALEEFVFLTFFEIENGLEKKSNLKRIATNRMNDGYMYLIGAKQNYLLEGRKGINIFKKIKNFTDISTENKEVIKGTTAFKGRERGTVRVILDRREANKLKKGEILVTTMTSPDFVPAMKRAKAIVTNEGGVLCHAAIMARELRKPCVIGTKIATDVLKNGDRVEVDATKGIIKIIGKK